MKFRLFRSLLIGVALMSSACLISLPVKGQSKPKSNADIILKLSLSKLNNCQLLDSLQQSVHLTGNLADHFSYDVTRFLLSKKVKIQESEHLAPTLKINVETHNKEQKIDKNLLFRQINGDLTVTLIDTTGIIEGVRKYNISESDTLNSKLSGDITGDWEPAQFDNSHTKKIHIWNRVVQPGLLISAIGVTVYLLFNVRSK
jgi:hypothetical protein